MKRMYCPVCGSHRVLKCEERPNDEDLSVAQFMGTCTDYWDGPVVEYRCECRCIFYLKKQPPPPPPVQLRKEGDVGDESEKLIIPRTRVRQCSFDGTLPIEVFGVAQPILDHLNKTLSPKLPYHGQRVRLYEPAQVDQILSMLRDELARLVDIGALIPGLQPETWLFKPECL